MNRQDFCDVEAVYQFNIGIYSIGGEKAVTDGFSVYELLNKHKLLKYCDTLKHMSRYQIQFSVTQHGFVFGPGGGSRPGLAIKELKESGLKIKVTDYNDISLLIKIPKFNNFFRDLIKLNAKMREEFIDKILKGKGTDEEKREVLSYLRIFNTDERFDKLNIIIKK